MPAAALAPSTKQGPWPLPSLGHWGAGGAVLISQLFVAKATAAPRQGPRLRSPEAGRPGAFQDWPSGASLLQQAWAGRCLLHGA